MEECQNRIIAELRNEVDIADEKVRTARIEANRTATMYENEIRSEMFKNNRLLLKRERESFGMTIKSLQERILAHEERNLTPPSYSIADEGL